MKVSELQALDFSSLKLGDRIELKNNGRPLPVLNIVQLERQCKGRRGFSRKFDKTVYDKISWLCGCEEKNAFFCFVCLLFGYDDNWTRKGVSDLKHLAEKIKRHENSQNHKCNCVSFHLLDRSNIPSSVSSAYAENIRTHNETVVKNRRVLSKIIDILKLCGQCNLTFREHDEEDSINEGVFFELMDYTKNIDAILQNHLQDAKVFRGTSKAIQNELLQNMLEVCKEHISNEINQSSFLALMAHDTTDLSTQTKTALVFRYELNGKIFERFWGFSIPESQDADGSSKCILEQLNSILGNSPEKLIAQTYDGAAVNVKIKEFYKNAHYVYCYAHQLNKLMEQAVSKIASVRIFFGNLNGISEFFSNSPDRMAALRRVCDNKIPGASETPWNFHSGLVQTVFKNKDDILSCFENIQLGVPKTYNVATTLQAAGFVKWFNDPTFLFWLNFFNNVMPHVEILFNQLPQIQTDTIKIQQAVDNFEKIIINIRDNLPPLPDEDPPAPKRTRFNAEDLHLSAREVCDIMLVETKDRFEFKNHLAGAKLFISKNYIGFKKNLPLDDINKFCEAFPMVDKDLLKMELGIFYSRPEILEENLNASGCLKLLNFLRVYGLDSTAFGEITKVLKILLTIPMTTSEPERCFSTLKLVKTCLRNTMSEDRVDALAMLSIEKTLVRDIPDFNNKVIEKFISDKNRRMEFCIKN